ncbi:MAG: tetratricopeptide repeat protein [Planctomycetota bacterium]
MVKKIHLMPLVLFTLVVLEIESVCFADPAAQLAQAQEYQANGDYGQAEAIYKAIVANYPGTDAALEAQELLVILYIRTYRDTEAGQALDKLVTDFAEHPGLLPALYPIAQTYEKWGKLEEAKAVHKQVAGLCRNASCALQAQKHIVMLCIWLNRDAETQEALNKLTADFSGNTKAFSRALYDIARRYEMAGKYVEAKGLYEQVIQLCPDPDNFGAYAGRARLGIPKNQIFSYIEAGQDSMASAALDQLMVDFAGHEYLPVVVYRAGELYYKKALNVGSRGPAGRRQELYQKALTIFELTIDRFPDADLTPQAHYCSADCYQGLGNLEKSIESYQIVYAKCSQYGPKADPEYMMAWTSLFNIGRNYEALSKSGAMSKSEADAKTKAVYEELLENYPKCKAANIVRRWLSKNNSE